MAAFSASRWAGRMAAVSTCSGSGNSSGGRAAMPLGSSHQIAAAAIPITTNCPTTVAKDRVPSAADSATASGSICSSRSTARRRSVKSVVDFGRQGRAEELADEGPRPWASAGRCARPVEMGMRSEPWFMAPRFMQSSVHHPCPASKELCRLVSVGVRVRLPRTAADRRPESRPSTGGRSLRTSPRLPPHRLLASACGAGPVAAPTSAGRTVRAGMPSAWGRAGSRHP